LLVCFEYFELKLLCTLHFIELFTGTLSADFVDITIKKVMGDDDLLTEKDTCTYPSSSTKLDEAGGSNSGATTDSQDKYL
jgi:hypothetical protein